MHCLAFYHSQMAFHFFTLSVGVHFPVMPQLGNQCLLHAKLLGSHVILSREIWLCRDRKGRVHVYDSTGSHAGWPITHDDYVWAEVSGRDSRGTTDQ